VILPDLAVFGAGGYLPGHRIDKDVAGQGEGGPTLNVVIADKTEYAALGEHSHVVLYGPIAETENEARSDAIPVNGLGHVASGDAGALKRLNNDEAVC
jgi:hypothetical protein